MGLESTTIITGLVATNPDGADDVSQGDNHLRLLKTVLLNCFSAIAGPVSASDVELSYVTGATSSIQIQINLKAPIASPTFTGIPAAPTPTAGDNSTTIPTTAFVTAAIAAAAVAGASTSLTPSPNMTPLSYPAGTPISGTIDPLWLGQRAQFAKLAYLGT